MSNPTRRKDMKKLRLRMDGDDSFMSSHQIKKTRVLFGQKDTPAWATNDAEIRRILLSVFPELKTRPHHRRAAARWNQAIVLVYRLGMSYSYAADEMGITYQALESLLRNIRRAAKGLRSDTMKPRTGKKGIVGRKKNASPPKPEEGSRETR
jgi:hypothetical protein